MFPAGEFPGYIPVEGNIKLIIGVVPFNLLEKKETATSY
jgi:hypothetical protein